LVWDVGPDITTIKRGDYVLIPAHCQAGKKNIVKQYLTPNGILIDDVILAHEDDVFAKIYYKNHTVYPIGRKVLVKRIIEDRKIGSIEVPDTARSAHQSLDVQIVRFGILKPGDFWRFDDVHVGDVVHLLEWREHMIELDYENEYCLIVNESDMEFRYEQQTK